MLKVCFQRSVLIQNCTRTISHSLLELTFTTKHPGLNLIINIKNELHGRLHETVKIYQKLFKSQSSYLH